MNSNENEQEGRAPGKAIMHTRRERLERAWAPLGAIGGLVGGIVCCVIGSVLTALAWVGFSPQFASLHMVGNLLLFLTIPLIVIGAFCLDLEERLDGKRSPTSLG